MKHLIKYTVVIMLVLLQITGAFAENFSYVYIQGDKQTPFYVKFEDEMLPRYGKNYSIIPQLSPGPIHIQILFQQNVYPAQSFTILVPESGFRGFLLTKKGDAFSLYDIHQQFYLEAGNTPEDDHIPASTPPITAVATNNNDTQLDNSNEDIGPNADTNLLGQPLSAPIAKVTTPKAKPSKPAKVVPVKAEPSGPAFMDMELDHGGSTNANAVEPKTDESYKGQLAITNSDCPRALDNDLFDAIKKKANDKSESSRLKYLLDKTMNNCFTTNQVRILTRTLSNDPERYTFLKKAYSRVTDQSAFPALENLLTSREWKDYFKLILP